MTDFKYNILFVCDFPFAGAGGVGRVTETLAAEFLRRGHSVTYLAFSAGEDYEAPSGIRQLFAPDGQSILSHTNATFLEQLLKELGIDILINQGGTKPELIKLFEGVNRGRTKLLSVHHNSVAALQENYPQIIAESYRGSRLAPVLRHRISAGALKAYNRFKLGLEFKRALQGSDRLVLLSERFIPELSIYLGQRFSREKVAGIVNPSPFAVMEGIEAKKENRLLYVGRVEYQQKRCDLLLEIWKRLYREFPHWTLDVVGEGSARLDLEKRALAEGLERIEFHGFRDPRPYLERSKLFCMTSAYEGFGMVLVEAQAYGVVPLAFDCFSSLQDIIQSGVNGYIMPKFDLDAYIGNLVELMTNEARRQSMAHAGQGGVGQFLPPAICNCWEELFNDLNAGGGGGHET